MIVIVGSRGNLSLALQSVFESNDLHIVGSEMANNWTKNGGDQKIEIDLNNLGVTPRLIINSAGLIDPNFEPARLNAVNFQLPKNLKLYSQRTGVKIVTFGTVMENFEEFSKSNSYLRSKRNYFEYLSSDNPSKNNSLHLQIHTWYGGESLHAHMFLGQMFSALLKKQEFEMSSGIQLREYHNIFDDVAAVQFLLENDAHGILQINHGEALRLKDIACTVFDAFGANDLLKFGRKESSKFENTQRKFQPTELLRSLYFRKTCPGIIEDFQKLLKKVK